MHIRLLLHNIRSVHNVGSMFRTGDGAGVEKIILSGYTPTPLDAHGLVRRDFAKVSLGAEHSVPWEHAPSLEGAIAQAKTDGYAVVALERVPGARSLFEYTPPSKVALVVGNEVTGIAEGTLTHADAVLEIPMQGTKESLNVSVAAGVALFYLAQHPGALPQSGRISDEAGR